MHHLICELESAPFFIPSTSFCSLSSWFTSSCAYHLITVTIFALTIYQSLPQSFTPDLKLISFANPFLRSSLLQWFYVECLHESWTCTELTMGKKGKGKQGRRHEFHNGGYKIVISRAKRAKKIFCPPNSYKLGVHDAYNAQLCCKS